MRPALPRPVSSTTWVILFATALGVGIGFAAARLVGPAADGPDAGDWLTAAGVLVGIVGSIATAVWIEDRQRSSERRADLKLMRDALEVLARSLQRHCEALPVSDTVGGVRIVVDREALEEALETVVFVREQVRPTDVLLWRRVRGIERQVLKTVVGLSDRATTDARLTQSEQAQAVLRADREALREMAVLTLPMVNAAIKETGR